MSSKVTKQKNAGRVAAGKRLAEWNRKNKFELSQEPSQELSQEPSQEPSQEHSQEQAIKSEYLYGVGFLIVVGLVIYAVKPAAATKTSPVKDPRKEEKQTHSVLKKRDPFLI